VNNVTIRHFVRGNLKEQVHAHNTMTAHGRTWLSKLVGYLNYAALLTETEDRVCGMMVGVGGVHADPSSFLGDLGTAYPAGSDPNATDGKSYRHEYAIEPAIGTMERPARIAGGVLPYPGAPTDSWKVSDFYTAHKNGQNVTCCGAIDCTAGELVYAPFTSVPLTELGLFTSETQILSNDPYNPIVAYVNFTPVVLTASSYVEIEWELNFT
jgi:hypothetical protein